MKFFLQLRFGDVRGTVAMLTAVTLVGKIQQAHKEEFRAAWSGTSPRIRSDPQLQQLPG